MMYEGQPFQIPGKELTAGSFAKIPNGLPVIEDRLIIQWTYGVGEGRMSPNRYVELNATNPAKIFGLYPKKGTLAVGADADIALWDPAATKTLRAATHHMRTDYSLYEGWQVTGLPVKVFRRGELLVDGNTWHGQRGSGRWTPRKAHGAVL